MSVTLSFTNQDHVGPGYAFTYIISAGPIPAGDYVAVTAEPSGAPNFTDAGIKITHGSLVGTIVFGIAETSSIANGPSNKVPDGTSMDITVTHYHANGTVVETTSYPAALPWDSTGKLYRLLEATTGPSGVLQQILAAVQVNKTTPGQV